ncbi:MAG: hypothetical protein GAK40_01241 [Burkholderia plantarii]|nr:MAG: hypothetical protein GAK40_01241 [Burkholderia plantarii]
MRAGDLAAARVPLMKAAELDQKNVKIISNVALFLYANGREQDAQGLMNQQHMAPQVQADIRADAARTTSVQRARQLAVVPQTSSSAGQGGQPLASRDGFDLSAPLLQRFSQ